MPGSVSPIGISIRASVPHIRQSVHCSDRVHDLLEAWEAVASPGCGVSIGRWLHVQKYLARHNCHGDKWHREVSCLPRKDTDTDTHEHR